MLGEQQGVTGDLLCTVLDIRMFVRFVEATVVKT